MGFVSPSCTQSHSTSKVISKKIDAYSSTANSNPETSCKESDCICEKNKNRHLCLKMKPLDFNAVSFDAVC